MAQRPSGSVSLPTFAEAKETKNSPAPGLGHKSARHEQSFEALQPQAGVARPLLELGPRHAVAPSVCFQHRALHSTPAPDRSRGRAASQYRATMPKDE
jgi:hypothetical protein